MKKQSLLQYVIEFIAWTLTPITFLIRIFIPAVPTQNELEILDVRAKLKEATDYKTWKKLAIQLDHLEGKEEWKKEKESPLYDYELIEFRLNKLRDLRAKGDIHGLVLALRAGLLRNLGGLGNVNLHTYCAYGTKYLVEEYISEVEKQLQFICDDPDIETEMDLQTKFNLFYETRQAFGRTALLLSGGAGLGLYHFGVIKALHEEGILEHIRVVSGSSVGSLIGSLFATKKSDEIPLLWEPGSLMLEAFEKKKEGNLRRKFNRLKTKGVLMDVSVLEDAIRKNIGDITFQEAFEKTGKVLNVPVASTKKFEFPRTLNYLTAPNVLIWSAASASCAFPGLYEPVQLMCKDHTGQIVEYHPSGLKWSDGSVESDLPMSRLSEMFNINHFIVSQVNPHIAPFLRNPKHKRNSGLLGKLKFFIKSEIRHRIYQMAEMGVFSSIVVRLQPLISQKYEGDITIVPEVTLDDYNHIISNPTEEFRQRCTLKMQNSTFEKIHIIKSHCRIEWCLEKCVAKLRKRLNSPEYYTQLHSPSGKKTNFKKESSFMFE